MLYYPDVDGRVPTESDAASGAEILEQYDGVYDSYNDPENGLDENVKRHDLSEKIAIPVTEGDGEIWTQVYVPVMEAVSAGAGEQYARLQLDWSDPDTGVKADRSIHRAFYGNTVYRAAVHGTAGK